MTRRVETTITLSRVQNVPTFYDAAGVPNYEAEDVEFEVEVSGTYHPAQRAYIYPGEYAPTDPPEPAAVEDITARQWWEGLGRYVDIELSDAELAYAEQKLIEDANE